MNVHPLCIWQACIQICEQNVTWKRGTLLQVASIPEEPPLPSGQPANEFVETAAYPFGNILFQVQYCSCLGRMQCLGCMLCLLQGVMTSGLLSSLLCCAVSHLAGITFFVQNTASHTDQECVLHVILLLYGLGVRV